MTDHTHMIAITGGIGSGKSVVAKIVTALGYSVYDCDTEAKIIIDSSAEIKSRIANEISHLAITSDNHVNRQKLGEIVFSDSKKLELLNTIVHAEVRKSLIQRRDTCRDSIMFVETAILYQSGIDRLVDEVWEITASEEIRIKRVVKRNNLSPDQVKARIDSQRFTPSQPHPKIFTIINDDITPLLPQILNRVASINNRF